MRQWIQRNRNQVSLETWTEASGSAAPVDRALVKVHAAIMKAELRQILDELQIVAAEYQIEVLRRLQKLMPTAQALVEETGDKELRETVASIAAQVVNVEAPCPGRCTTLGTQIMNLRRFLIGSYLEIPSRQLITMAMIRNLLVNLREADCRALASTGSRWARMKRLTGR